MPFNLRVWPASPVLVPAGNALNVIMGVANGRTGPGGRGEDGDRKEDVRTAFLGNGVEWGRPSRSPPKTRERLEPSRLVKGG